MRRAAYLLPFLLVSVAGSSTAQIFTPAPAPVPALAYAPSTDVGYAVNDWRRLRQGGSFSFADYARFLIYNPGWPGETTLRRAAEKAMRSGENPATVIAFFRDKKPVSGNGHARLADALSAAGRQVEAMAAVRDAWAADDLSTEDETAIAARYWSNLTAQDHDRRADSLLFAKKPEAAQRVLTATSAARRAAFASRIAMQTRAPNVDALYQPMLATVVQDAGLMMDRARYLRDANWEAAARQLAARQHNFSYKPADPERMLDMLLILAGGAADAGDWSTAFNIARQADDVFPAGTDISDQPLGVRDAYTSLVWLGGTAAWSGLNRPADAAVLFQRYSRAGKSLQVTTKGLYWAGRASLAAGRAGDASGYFQRAAAYPELFYGQLALERLGRKVPAPNQIASAAVTPQARAEFASRRLVRAMQLVGQQGRYDEQSLFIRTLSESLTSDAERIIATEMAPRIGRQDLAVWVARSARNKGSAFYVQNAYPQLGGSRVPSGRMWSLAHGITRQESSFDRAAVSHAGARGLMQLMPGTAAEQASKMGVGYEWSRLTTDPSYNVMLGSAYFQRMLNTWDGNVPLAVASYNAGAGNVRKWVNRYGDPRRGKDVLQWIEQIPFSETKGYVQRVIENTVVYDQMNASTPSTTVHVSAFLNKHPPG
ncbi:MAG TPA: lytic transglycosylase domain-containing protein [Sphingomicrobium sp.]|nr:lytic transglycosylase domain-containing protein [Sphingomicrobium sp.]